MWFKTHIHPWLIHVNVWQKPLQYKKKEKEKKNIQCHVHYILKLKTYLKTDEKKM